MACFKIWIKLAATEFCLKLFTPQFFLYLSTSLMPSLMNTSVPILIPFSFSYHCLKLIETVCEDALYILLKVKLFKINLTWIYDQDSFRRLCAVRRWLLSSSFPRNNTCLPFFVFSTSDHYFVRAWYPRRFNRITNQTYLTCGIVGSKRWRINNLLNYLRRYSSREISLRATSVPVFRIRHHHRRAELGFDLIGDGQKKNSLNTHVSNNAENKECTCTIDSPLISSNCGKKSTKINKIFFFFCLIIPLSINR